MEKTVEDATEKTPVNVDDSATAIVPRSEKAATRSTPSASRTWTTATSVVGVSSFALRQASRNSRVSPKKTIRVSETLCYGYHWLVRQCLFFFTREPSKSPLSINKNRNLMLTYRRRACFDSHLQNTTVKAWISVSKACLTQLPPHNSEGSASKAGGLRVRLCTPHDIFSPEYNLVIATQMR